MKVVAKLLLAICLASIGISKVEAQQNFSCSYGARGACLGYSDKIVDQNAVCFSEATCGFGGFVCKSKLEDVANEYDRLVNSYNDLSRKNRSLVDTAQELLNKNNMLVNDYNELLAKYNRLLARQR